MQTLATLAEALDVPVSAPLDSTESPVSPNLVLRRIREDERQETRVEFAEAMRRKAIELGEDIIPTERSIARLEAGETRYPHPATRRVLTALCGRSMQELGFTRPVSRSVGLSDVAPNASDELISVTKKLPDSASRASVAAHMTPWSESSHGEYPHADALTALRPPQLPDGIAGSDALLAARADADLSPQGDKITPEPRGSAHKVFTGFDDMNRRELLRIMTMVGVLTSAASLSDEIDWDRVGFGARTGKVDFSAIGDLAALNDHLWRVFVLSRVKQAVFPLVRDHLDMLVSTLSNAGNTDAYRRLCGCASSAFQLCGEILFDGNLYTEAAHCYLLAATAGREAGINDLWACALTRHAFIGLYERRFDRAAPLLDLADVLARNGDQALATRHWVAAVQAQAFAGLGRLSECQRALEAADHVRELSGNYHNGGWLRFDGSRLAEERGACYVQLKSFDLAESALTDALSHHLSPRRRGGVLVDLAILGIQQNDLDQTLSYADATARIIQQTGSGYVVRKLITLQPYLQPFMDDVRIRNLNGQIGALTMSTTTG